MQFTPGEALILAGMKTLIDEGKTAREVLDILDDLGKRSFFGLQDIENKNKKK